MLNIPRRKIVIVTTVPETISTILRGQPRYLNKYFSVSIITSPGLAVEKIKLNESIDPVIVKINRNITPLKDLVSILRLIYWLKIIKPDVVHSFTPKAGLVTMVASYICGIKYRIHTFTGLIFPTSKGLKKILLLNIDRLICFLSTNIIPEGLGVKNDLIDYKITQKNLKIIGNGNIAGIDTNYFNPSLFESSKEISIIKKKTSLNEGDFIFCFIGRLNKDKGLDELIMSFINLPTKSKLLIVGELDESLPPEKNTLHLIEIHDRIMHVGFKDDIRPWLFVSDVLVLPSYREGFPNVLLQAGSMKKPVIATNINGCNEIVINSINGWLVPPRDSISLCAAMKCAINIEKSKLVEMGTVSRKIIKSKFEKSKHLTCVKNYYYELFK